MVSVIIPVYNGEKTIKRCLESVMGQTLSDIEIIVVNDGSRDNTANVVADFDDGRIRVINIENSGQGYARNAGIEASSGEYLAFADADDEMASDMLEKMYAEAKRTDADVVQCNILDIYPDGRRVVQLPPLDETVDITNPVAHMDKYFTTCRHSYEVCNKLIKRDAVGSLRFGDTKKYFSEDLLFNMELIRHIRRITFVSEPLYLYYKSAQSHLHKNADNRLSGLCALFRDYINGAPGEMKDAAAFTAAMVLSYSACDCEGSAVAREMLGSDGFEWYIRKALKRNCGIKRRLFLTVMLLSPLNVRVKLAEWYGGRWQK